LAEAKAKAKVEVEVKNDRKLTLTLTLTLMVDHLKTFSHRLQFINNYFVSLRPDF